MAVMALAPTKSTFIAQYYPDSNFYDHPNLFVSRYKKTGDVYRTLLQFGFYRNISPLPPKSRITQAKLVLTIVRNEISRGSIELSVHKIWQSWLKSEVTWNNQPLFSISRETSAQVKSGFSGHLHLDLSNLAMEWEKETEQNFGFLLAGDEDRNRLLALGGRETALHIEYD